MAEPETSLSALQTDIQALRQEISELRGVKANLLQQQLRDYNAIAERFAQDQIKELEERKQALERSVEQLERRKERIEAEMNQNFAGVSQDISVRVQGFRDYLTSSLQDLVTSVEQLELTPPPAPAAPPRTERLPDRSSDRDLDLRSDRRSDRRPDRSSDRPSDRPSDRSSRSKRADRETPEDGRTVPLFAAQSFQEEARQIRKLLDQYRTNPNYYGPPWQLRRTFEPVHAERVAKWFFTFGGRGALPTLNSRLQNILVASAAISIVRRVHGDRLRTLILADSPERLGDWRRGLQDCLGISRTDFGPERGIVLFESPDSLAQKADRLVKADLLPLILLDDAEEQISLSILQFPLWLVFAPEPQLRRERGSTFEWFE